MLYKPKHSQHNAAPMTHCTVNPYLKLFQTKFANWKPKIMKHNFLISCGWPQWQRTFQPISQHFCFVVGIQFEEHHTGQHQMKSTNKNGQLVAHTLQPILFAMAIMKQTLVIVLVDCALQTAHILIKRKTWLPAGVLKLVSGLQEILHHVRPNTGLTKRDAIWNECLQNS